MDDIDEVSGDVHVSIAGELDVWTTPTMARALGRLFGTTAAPVVSSRGGTVQLDLSRLSFVDTSGMLGLSDYAAALVAHGWRLRPQHAQRQIGRLLGFAEREGWLPKEFRFGCTVPHPWTGPDAPDLPNVESGAR